jgi:hypothetical protein
MRSALVFIALTLAACQPGAGRISYATPIPPPRITSPDALVGSHGVAGVGGVAYAALQDHPTVSITQDRISMPGNCAIAGWSYSFDGDRLITKAIAGPTCRRALTPEERGLVAAFTGANKVSRTAVDGLIFEGTGGTVTLFQ